LIGQSSVLWQPAKKRIRLVGEDKRERIMARHTSILVAAAVLVFSSLAPAALVGYYQFENVNLAQASVGESLLAVNSPAADASGRFGGAIALNGSNQVLAVNNGSGGINEAAVPAGFPTGSSPYTISMWIKTDSWLNAVGANQGMIGWGAYGSGGRVNAFRLNNANGMINYWWSRDLAVNPGPVTDSQWHHVLATWDGTTRSIYVDGVVKGSDSLAAPNVAAANFRIGKTYNNEYFKGSIDDVAVYTNGVSASQAYALASGVLPTALPAATNTVSLWTAAAGDWNLGSNWSTDPTVPTTGYDAYINNGGTATLAGGMTANPSTLVIGGLGGGTLNYTGGTLSAPSITISTGGVLSTATGIDYNEPNGGSVTVQDNGQLLGARNIRIGNGGTGALTVTGGTVSAGQWFVIAQSAGNVGTVTMTGGTLYANAANLNGHLEVGSSGTGTLNLSGTAAAEVMNNYDVQIGNAASGIGTLNLSESASLTARVIRAGVGGTGAYNQTGGTATARTWFVVGQNANSNGTATITGGTLNVNTSGGGNFQVGVNAGGTNILNVGGTAQVLLNNNAGLWIASDNASSNGTVNQSGGLMSVSGSGSVVVGRAGTGVYNLNGGTLRTPGVTRGSGTGTFNFNGGTLMPTAASATFFQGLTAAYVQAGGAVIDTNGVDVTVAQPLLAGSPSGGLTKNGNGTLTLTGANTYTGTTAVNGGTLALNANNIIAGPLVINGGATVTQNAGDRILDNQSVTINGGTYNLLGNTDYFATLTMSNAAQVLNSGAGFIITNGLGGSKIIGAGSGNAGTIASTVALCSQWGNLGAQTGTRTQEFQVDPGATLTVTGQIINSGAGSGFTGSLLKSGGGTLVLTNQANNYVGTTAVNAGTLVLQGGNGTVIPGSAVTVADDATIQWNASHNIGDSIPVTVNGGTLNLQNRGEYLGVLTLNDGSQVSGTSGSFLFLTGAQGLIQASGNAGAIQPDIAITSPPGWGPNGGVNRTQVFDVAAGGNLTVSGRILNVVPDGSASTVGSVVKSGSGTLLLTGASNYSGGTTVQEGVLAIGAGGTISPNAIVVEDGGTLRLDRQDVFGNHSTTPGGALTVQAGGTVASNGWFNTLPPLTLSGGTLLSNGGHSDWGSFALKGAVAVTGSTPSAIATGGGAAGNFIRIGTNADGGSTTFDVADVTADADADLVVGTVLTNNRLPASTVAVISGLNKTGAGTMVLNAANTYTGPTNIYAGTLTVNGSITSPVTIDPGATLGGNGTTGNVTAAADAHVAPGASAGTLHTLDLALQPDSFFDVEISPSAWDSLDVAGAVSLDAAALNLAVLASFSQYGGSQYVIIENDSDDPVVGFFQDLPPGATIEVAGAQFAITYEGGTGNDVVLTAVPEPASLGLLLAGAAGLGGYLRRRRTR